MTAAPVLDLPPVCADCAKLVNRGLCGKESCRRAVLPQIAKPALVRLIGETLTEQTKRQKPLAPKEKAAIARIGRRNARKTARAKRGPYALLRAILAK